MRGLVSIYDYAHFASRSDAFACVCISLTVIPGCIE
jgi:hypothetical protein